MYLLILWSTVNVLKTISRPFYLLNVWVRLVCSILMVFLLVLTTHCSHAHGHDDWTGLTIGQQQAPSDQQLGSWACLLWKLSLVHRFILLTTISCTYFCIIYYHIGNSNKVWSETDLSVLLVEKICDWFLIWENSPWPVMICAVSLIFQLYNQAN